MANIAPRYTMIIPEEDCMRFIAFLMLALMCLSLAACPKQTEEAPEQPAPAADDTGSGDGGGWDGGE